MSDWIDLTGVSATGHHGVLPQERRDGQIFVVDVALETDMTRAAASDDLADTIDYSAVAADIVAIIEGEPADLIETVAERIASACLTREAVLRVKVTLHKPQAPVGVPFDDVAVRITRRRRLP